MKKTFMAMLAAFSAAIVMAHLMAGAAPQPVDNFSGSRASSYSYIEDSSNSTVTLVSGVTNNYVTLYKFILSTSAADNFYLRCGSNQKTAKIYLSANSGLDSTFYPLYIRCAVGEALSIVKGTASTPIGISLWFTQQR